jgi:Leucine Rich repeat
MPISTSCSSCGVRLKVNESLLGRKAKCPKCGEVLVISEATEPAIPTKSNSARTLAESEQPKGKQRARQEEEHFKAQGGYALASSPEEVPVRRKRAVPRDDDFDGADGDEDLPPEEDRPRKKKKRRKKKRLQRPGAPMPSWLWWLGGTVALMLVVLLAGLFLIKEGHRDLVVFYGLAFAVMLPISVVIMIIAMILSSALAGGIEFGELHDVIIKSIALLFVINLIYLIPFVGGMLAFPFWLFGSMILFRLDVWEARFFIFINWLLNLAVKYFLLGLVLTAIMQAKAHDEINDAIRERSTPANQMQEGILDDIERRGGEYDVDDNDPEAPVVRIKLAGGQFADADIGSLKGFNKLRRLEIGSTQVTDAGLAELAELSSLQALDLSRTRITDKGLAQLKRLKQLQWLVVTGTKVTDKGVKELQKALPKLQVTR